jgi:hypothetical protein
MFALFLVNSRFWSVSQLEQEFNMHFTKMVLFTLLNILASFSVFDTSWSANEWLRF